MFGILSASASYRPPIHAFQFTFLERIYPLHNFYISAVDVGLIKMDAVKEKGYTFLD
jgi:hypothetical protein